MFHSRPDVSYVPVTDMTPEQVCLAVPESHTSPLVDDFVAAAQATAETTAECGNSAIWERTAELQALAPVDPELEAESNSDVERRRGRMAM